MPGKTASSPTSAPEPPVLPKFVRTPTQYDLPPAVAELSEGVRLPNQYELPDEDGEPMESSRHRTQINLLMETLEFAWADRDVFIGGNMFVYFDPEQTRNRKFRGPDVFVVQDVPRGERRSWVVWDEHRAPDVVIELLSFTTADVDRVEKKQVYQDELRVPGYFWYDPWTGELAGFLLKAGKYVALEPEGSGLLPCEPLGLALTRWQGTYQGADAEWLRWAYPDGTLLPTPAEAERQQAAIERQRAEAERERAEAERGRAERLAARLRELGEEL